MKSKFIKQEGKDKIICRIRRIPLVVHSEELFRQRLLNALIDMKGFEEENIGVEVPLAHFKHGAKDRADIVVFDKPKYHADAQALILIECKDPENDKINIREYWIEKQVERYAAILQPIFHFATKEYDTYGKDRRTNKEIDYIPSLLDIKKNKIKYIKPKPMEWVRCSYEEKQDKDVHQDFINAKFISIITKEDRIPYLIQLMDLFYDLESSFSHIKLSDQLILTDDIGFRLGNFGYAGSGGLMGFYRCLVLGQSDGNSRVLGYSIYPQGTWGTYLMVSVDDRKGHALELRLDKAIEPTGETTYKITHTGAMTVGNRGRITNKEVIDYVGDRAPFLITDGIVLLGRLDLKNDLKFRQKDVQDFILRTATYAILRDELRQKLET